MNSPVVEGCYINTLVGSDSKGEVGKQYLGVKVILQLGLALCVGTGVVTQTIPALRRQRHNWGLRGRNQKPHKLNAWTLDITNATR